MTVRDVYFTHGALDVESDATAAAKRAIHARFGGGHSLFQVIDPSTFDWAEMMAQHGSRLAVHRYALERAHAVVALEHDGTIDVDAFDVLSLAARLKRPRVVVRVEEIVSFWAIDRIEFAKRGPDGFGRIITGRRLP